MHTWYNQPSKERMLVLFSWPRDFSTWEEAGKKYRAEPSHLSPSQEGKERKMRLKFHYLLQGHILISRRPLSWPCHLKLSGPSCRAKSSHKRFGETFKIQTSAMIIWVAAIFWLFQECSRTSLGWPVNHEAFILFFNEMNFLKELLAIAQLNTIVHSYFGQPCEGTEAPDLLGL